ncbi:hypothetical protein JZU46_05235 [bacterium]|nr:hypothetical protein [bacterium]
MTNYTPPNNNSILFNFSAKGYSKPDFGSVSFNFSSQELGDLQASINVTQLYYDTTYTYTKSCRKVIVGYSSAGVQVMELPCLFGGIRDFEVRISTKARYTSDYCDFPAHLRSYNQAIHDLTIFSRAWQINNIDLLAYSRALKKDTLNLVTASRARRSSSKSFSSFVRQSLRASLDLSTYMKFVRGHAIISDLLATLIDIQPVNIAALLNIIELRELPIAIEGVYFKGTTDIYTDFGRVSFRNTKNIVSNIRGWAIKDLHSTIKSFWTKDLSADLLAGYFKVGKNLSSLIYAIAPKNLGATLHGYDCLNLNVFTITGFTPNDLQAYIDIIKFENLTATIYGKFGVGTNRNLPVFIRTNHVSFLSAYIDVNEARNLEAYIDAVGKYLDLVAKIAPRTINIKRMLFIPLLEHSDLKATIQYSCKSSGFRDFTASLYPIRKLDLKGYIIGWYGGTSDNIIDLAAHINYHTYAVQNYINIEGYARNNITAGLDITVIPRNTYRVFDTFAVSGGNAHKLLSAYIIGHFQSLDLTASLVAKPIANFTATPSWMNPAKLEAVINLTRFEERWTRFVEMIFFTNSKEDFHYFYVSGENKIYKIDKKRTWKINITGYAESTDSIYERIKVKKKFIFNLDNYKNVDEAVRDLIDRVTAYKFLDLSATINAYDFEYLSLAAKIKAAKRHSWSTTFKTNIKGTVRSQFNYTATIYPKLNKDINNLTALIVGKAYEAPQPDNITFKFIDAGYSASPYYNNMDWTYKQAEVFWK